jgi:hypothetical protein
MALTRKIGMSYRHVQSEAASTWTISHNLGMYPTVDVFVDINGTEQKIIPMNIAYTNENECVVTFSSNNAGVAIVS